MQPDLLDNGFVGLKTRPTNKTKKSWRETRHDFFVEEKTSLRRCFTKGLDALGAQRLLDQTTLFHHRNLLEVGFERAVGSALGKGAVVTKGGCLAAVIALCHV